MLLKYNNDIVCGISVQFSCSVVSDSLQSHGLQHSRLPCPPLSPGVCSNSRPLSIPSKQLILCRPLLLLPSIFLSISAFLMSQLFTSGGQRTGASASASVIPMNIQGWFPLGLTGLISLQSKGLSRVFSNTTVQKHQFFGTQLSSTVQLSHSYMTTEKSTTLTRRTFVGRVMSLLFICCLGWT